MKGVIRWALNHIPRRFLQRVAGWAVPIMGLAYRGRGRECPVCGSRYRRFMPYGYVTSREDALCPHCLSLERHRMIWLWLKESSNLFEGYPRLLHIAPEVSLMRHFKRHYRDNKSYITADLESPLADLHFDVQSIPLEDEYIDVIICNHLLEHVEDDRRAMAELYRILKKGGWGIMLVPEDRSRARTFEDDTITDPEERTRIFGQYDHRRIYGRDYDKRLAEAGFRVERIAYAERLSDEQRRRYAIGHDDLVVVYKD
ncbi:MAG: methyltransferase domain-containing protein [Alistipes sp.]|nr:methyltransferase domain-containing protein [Alistipes sp.]